MRSTPPKAARLDATLTIAEIEERLGREDLDEWLRWWWTSQGGEPRNQQLRLISEVLPYALDSKIRVLDLCCGPGDLGRLVHERFPKAFIDCVDRDPFLVALCTKLNRGERIAGQMFVRDMWDPNWTAELPHDYDAVVVSASLHWFDVSRLGELFRDVFGLLKRGGVFLFDEPARARQPFALAFEEWKAKQADGYDPTNWDKFWARVNSLLGYDHTEVLSARPAGRVEIGDDGITIAEYFRLLHDAGFESIDVLQRDAWNVILAAASPNSR